MALLYTLEQLVILSLEGLLEIHMVLMEVQQIKSSSRTASTTAQSITVEQQQTVCTLEGFGGLPMEHTALRTV